MLEISSVRKGFREEVHSGISFVRSLSNFADGITKAMERPEMETSTKEVTFFFVAPP